MTSNLDNIPQELKDLQQWVCFDVVDGKKIPYIPGTDDNAASNRPRDWRSFRAACKDVESGKRSHVGFCFASTDPYVFIDLDAPEDEDQARVFKRLRTYAQKSVSGEGAHLICKGSFKGKGRHPAYPAAGIFKEHRFAVMTGDLIKKRATINAVADEDLQSVHTWLSKGGGNSGEDLEDLTEYAPKIPDMAIFEMGCERFHKYWDLANGAWEKYDEFNGDHSTADHAFLAMLCDLTESNQQVRYLFSISGMWNEERAAKKAGHGFEGYVNRTIQKIRSKQARDARIAENITLAFGEDEVDVPDPEPIAPVKVKGDENLIESLPDGLIKDLARYSYRTSYLPLQEASILAALMFVSGLCGRGFLTPTKSGLNLWLVLVGGTSCGKDEYQNGMKRLITAVSKNVPHIRKIFGGEIVSGPGIEAVFQDTFRYISYVPEFGDTFKLLANPQAPEYVKTLSRGLLNSYNAAGQGGSSEGRRKAQGSDEKVFVERPCLCIAGEATPESLYGAMTSRELATGFLQRFILLDVPLSSWSLEENKRHGAAPPKELVARLEQLALAMDKADVSGQFTVIEASPEADEILKNYRNSKRREIMACSDGLAKKEVINRAGLKAIRIASLVAVSSDFYAPRIEVAHALWAIEFVERADEKILKRFESGEIGSGQVKQETEITRACKNILAMTYLDKRALGMSKKLAKDDLVIPVSTIKKLVINNAAFATDRLGAVTAFDKCIDSMCKVGVFVKLGESFALDKYDHLHGVLLCMNRDTLK